MHWNSRRNPSVTRPCWCPLNTARGGGEGCDPLLLCLIWTIFLQLLLSRVCSCVVYCIYTRVWFHLFICVCVCVISRSFSLFCFYLCVSWVPLSFQSLEFRILIKACLHPVLEVVSFYLFISSYRRRQTNWIHTNDSDEISDFMVTHVIIYHEEFFLSYKHLEWKTFDWDLARICWFDSLSTDGGWYSRFPSDEPAKSASLKTLFPASSAPPSGVFLLLWGNKIFISKWNQLRMWLELKLCDSTKPQYEPVF